MIDEKKYLRYDKTELSYLSHSELVDIAYFYIDKFKHLSYQKQLYKTNLERRVEKLTNNLETLQQEINKLLIKSEKYNLLINRKLTFKERFIGKIKEQ